MNRVGMIGAGSWGTALSVLLCNNGHEVTIWSIMESEIEMLKENREHLDKLPGVKIPGFHPRGPSLISRQGTKISFQAMHPTAASRAASAT